MRLSRLRRMITRPKMSTRPSTAWALVAAILVLAIKLLADFGKGGVRQSNDGDVALDVLFYNNVPKTGSGTFTHLLLNATAVDNVVRIAKNCVPKRNSSRQRTEQEQLEKAEKIMSLPRPAMYRQEIHFIDFAKFGLPNPVYFSVVREPYERFKSKFFFVRSQAEIDPEKQREFYKRILTYEPGMVSGRSYREWLEQDFESCVMGDDIRECNFRPGDIVDHPISYFCGQGVECVRFDSELALQRAKENVERHYPVVAIVDRMEDSLNLMERRLPAVFTKGISNFFDGQVYHAGSGSKTVAADEGVERAMREKMRRVLSKEYDFYNFCQRRMDEQLKQSDL